MECPICYNTFTEFKIKLKCSHILCLSCITSWMLNKPNCPICRTVLKVIEVKTILRLEEWKLYANTGENIITPEKNNALYSIGYCLKKGIVLEKNIEKSIIWFEKACKFNDINSLTELSYIYENEYKDFNKAFKFLLNAINILQEEEKFSNIKNDTSLLLHNSDVKIKPNTRVWYNIANFYYAGKGCPINFKLAFEYFLKAAENELLESQYNVAVCYQEGIGTKKNLFKALSWYIESAKSGYDKSIQFLKNNNIEI